jgi:hypothetical protein
MLRNSRKHPRPDFLTVMKRENVVGKSGALKDAMRARLAFDAPANSQECSQNALCPG